MNDKKDIERFYLDEFLKLLGKKPENIHAWEAPDFIVHLHHSEIGIELTEFHSALKGERGRPRRLVEEAWASLQENIMNEVRKYEELRHTNGLLSFKYLEIPRNSDCEPFVKELIQLSLDMIKSGCQCTMPGIYYPSLNRHLKNFSLKKINCYITWEWNHNASSIGLDETDMINVVKPKIEKASNYIIRKFDELWLIIVSGTRLSQLMPHFLTEELKFFSQLDQILKQSNYSKVFVFQYGVGVIHEWPGWVKIGKERLYPTLHECSDGM